MKKYRLIKAKEDCVLVQRTDTRNALYIIRDIENETICMTYDKANAEAHFESYDLAKQREAVKAEFEQWKKDNVEGF